MPRPSRTRNRWTPLVRQEHVAFLAALGIGLLHAVDEALVHRQPGVPADQHLAGLLVVALGCTMAAWGFPHLRPGARSALALVAGVLSLANGALHVLHVALTSSVGPADPSGVAAAVAGVALLGLGATVPLRHRGERAGGRRRRWVRRGVAVVVGVAVAQLVLVPVVVAVVQTHQVRREVVRAPSDAYRPVSFRSADGLRLDGWYRPSRNRAAVLVVNSSAGDRNGSLRHARLLARHGYGVLLYDARGSGTSEGAANGWGWGWQDDVAGAVQFLRSRPDVDDDRIGGLGLSTGADVLIEFAAAHRGLRAVVADGATARSVTDAAPGALDAPAVWLTFTAGRVLSGTSPGRPLSELVAEAAPTPVLLVATGSLAGELEYNQRYADAGPSTTLWRLPQVSHTNAVSEVADAYERRVIGHLDSALLR